MYLEIFLKFQSYPMILRQSFIRHSSGSFVEKGDLAYELRVKGKYLIYEIDDGSKTNEPFVFKSGKRKIKILRNLYKDKVHPLAFKTVYMDVLHSYTKEWRTYSHSTNGTIIYDGMFEGRSNMFLTFFQIK